MHTHTHHTRTHACTHAHTHTHTHTRTHAHMHAHMHTHMHMHTHIHMHTHTHTPCLVEDGKQSWTSGTNVRCDQTVLTAGRPDTVGKNSSALSLFTRFYYITCDLLFYDPFKYSQQEKPSCLENREENISRERQRKLQTGNRGSRSGAERKSSTGDRESQINTKSECIYMHQALIWGCLYLLWTVLLWEWCIYIWKSSKFTVIALQKCFGIN